MFENIIKFFKNIGKKESTKESSDTAKERLHLVLMQDRANVSADFLELMKQEIIEVIKKYIEVDEKAIDVRLTNKASEDGTVGAPALYANIPITTINFFTIFPFFIRSQRSDFWGISLELKIPTSNSYFPTSDFRFLYSYF